MRFIISSVLLRKSIEKRQAEGDDAIVRSIGLFLALALAAISAPAQTGATATRNDATPSYTAARGLGVSLGCYGYYDSCQIDKNLVAADDPNFEPTVTKVLWAQSVAGTGTLGSASTNSYQTRNIYVPTGGTATANTVWTGGTDTIIQSPTASLVGCTDIISSASSQYTATASTTSGSNVLTVQAYQNVYATGQSLSGSNLQTGTTVTDAVAGGAGQTTITMSLPATATGSFTVTAVNADGNEGNLVYKFVPGTSTPGGTTSGNCGGAPAGTVHVLTSLPSATIQVGANYEVINGVATSGLVTMDTATPIDGLGSLQIDGTPTGAFVQHNMPLDATSSNRFVDMTGTFTVSMKVRLISGPGTFTAALSRASSGGISCTQTVPVTTTATTYTFTCTGTESTSRPVPGNVSLVFTANSNKFDVDDVTVIKNGQTNPSSFRDEYVYGLQQKYFSNNTTGSRPTYRFGPEIQNGETYANWTATSTAAHPTSYSAYGTYSGHPRLPDYLAATKAMGAVPYFALPVVSSTAEAVSYYKFLFDTVTNDPVNHAEAYFRANTWAHPPPYGGPTGDFPMIYICWGNELWNYADAFLGGDFPGATGPDQYYDQKIQEGKIWQAIRALSIYQPAYTTLISNVQTTNPSGWTTEIAAQPANGRPDAAETAPYIGLSFTSVATNEAKWRIGLSTPQAQINNSAATYNQTVTLIQAAHICGPAGTSACGVTVYEEGPGDVYACGASYNGTAVTPACQTNQAGALQDDQTLQSDNVGAGMGLIMAAEWADNLKAGILAQNLFASNQFGGPSGQNDPYAGAPRQNYLWGMAVDYGGAESTLDGAYVRARPQMLTGQIANYVAMPNIVPCPNTGGTYSQPAAPNPAAVPASTISTLDTTCFSDGTGNYAMFVVNLSTSQAFNLTVAGTDSTLGTVSGLQFAPGNLDTVNEAVAIAPSYGNPSLFAQTHNAPLNLSNAVISGSGMTSISIPPNSVTGVRYQTASVVLYQLF